MTVPTHLPESHKRPTGCSGFISTRLLGPSSASLERGTATVGIFLYDNFRLGTDEDRYNRRGNARSCRQRLGPALRVRSGADTRQDDDGSASAAVLRAEGFLPDRPGNRSLLVAFRRAGVSGWAAGMVAARPPSALQGELGVGFSAGRSGHKPGYDFAASEWLICLPRRPGGGREGDSIRARPGSIRCRG